jgi:hypothetical protein
VQEAVQFTTVRAEECKEMSAPKTSPARSPREDGFTLIEMVVAVGLAAFIFAALASVLGSSLTALAAQKARSQGNELVTRGMEDLQRYDFEDLGVCAGPSGPAPAELAGRPLVVLPNCPSPVPANYGADPCTGISGAVQVVKTEYSCNHAGITYAVRRYVVWDDDPNRTVKRLAVYVNWTDRVGNHQVSQQSSLRTPTAATAVGQAPPQFVATSITPASSPSSPILLDGGSGKLRSGQSLSFYADIDDLTLTANDKVYVSFQALRTDPVTTLTAPESTTFALTSGDGQNWNGTINDSTIDPNTETPYRLPAGSQFFTFTVVRSTTDGKVNSKFHVPAPTFCPGNDDGNQCPSNLPRFSSEPVIPAVVDIDTAGVLQSPFTVSATTENLLTTDSVSVSMQTQEGAASFVLQPDSSCTATGPCNNWSLTVQPSSVSHRFPGGPQRFFFSAWQAPVPGVSDGSSAALRSATAVNFQ